MKTFKYTKDYVVNSEADKMATQKLETEKARFENIAKAVGKKYG